MSSPNLLDDSNNVNEAKKIPPNKVPVGIAKGPNLKNTKSKIGSLNNVNHKPAGGQKKIESQKLNWNTSSRVGSLQNANHKPKGGNVRVTTQKLDWNVKSKVGSLDNVKHSPGGGNVRIFDEKYAGSSKAPSTRSGNSTPNTSLQYCANDLLKETEQKLSIKE
ncbi:hypothetical protein RDWZM_002678 [Blomia tropicalis]|uniref:Microtubule-associated protein n=1 Tax=Blomia tropicalis TaxID=40697 RepID=A0A9Q0MD81_BLOTA|nr:Methionine aminopeptidase 2 [Blomia tropicalis]KAJ6224133.1 hypothetical protein RDWZM_002678 [Blomia tropicalis]